MHKFALFLFLATGCCANTFASAAITTPYSNDFSSNDPASVIDFSLSLSEQWTLVGGKFRNEILSTAAPDKSSSSMLRYIGLGGNPGSAKDFFLNTTFTITNSVGDFNSLGFAVLGNDGNATASASRSYLADVFVGGSAMNAKLRFSELGPDYPGKLPMTTLDLGKKLAKDVVYSLQLQGLYDEFGSLKMKLKILGDSFDPNGIFTETTSISSDKVLQGEYFGFRNRSSGLSDSLAVEFDSVNIAAIPEPASIGFVATSLIAGYAIGRYMRRRFAEPTT